MMLGFDIGLRALLASQIALDVTGNNVANVDTPGFTRRSIRFAALSPTISGPRIQAGRGVEVSDVRRVVNDFVTARLQSSNSSLGGAEVQRDRLRDIENVLGAGGDSDLGTSLDSLFSSLSALTAEPDSSERRSSALSSAEAVVREFRRLSSDLAGVDADVGSQLASSISEVNRISSTIANLNVRIREARAAAGGNVGASAEFEDARDAALQELSKIVDVQTVTAADGTISVISAGRLLASGSRAGTLRLDTTPSGEFQVKYGSGADPLTFRNGQLPALLDLSSNKIPGLRSQLDDLAKNLALEFNRIHATGVRLSGPLQSATSSQPAIDRNGNGDPNDDVLANAGLPIDPKSGVLQVAVVNLATGAVDRTSITIDPQTTTMTSLAAAVDAIAHIRAQADDSGRLRITAESGYGFEFSPRLDPLPDRASSFGSVHGTITSTATPGSTFALANGNTLSVSVDGGASQTVTFNSGDFADISQATADEVAAVLNAQLTGTSASVSNGKVVLASLTSGPSSSLAITDGIGTPAATLGLSTTLETGSTTSASPRIEGSYSGTTNDSFTFRALSNGTIGLTAGLQVGVFDANDTQVAVLDVGSTYIPGGALTVADGVVVRFSAGAISATSGDSFKLDLVGQPDTADILPALGLAGFFTGATADTIAIDPSVDGKPSAIALGLGPDAGDNGAAVRLAALASRRLDGLSGLSASEFHAALVTGVAQDVQSADQVATVQQSVFDGLSKERESVSGVSLDEEMVNMIQFQRSFESAARFISVTNQVSQELLNLIR
ncbi:MAG: flagellar hook-associated protein FlgK [Planctomycetes bacterium]|nr:flagellar hook-associated protein FlgK [Planctomycetota bacterium]MBI3843033.1 flagellar hook-associated protein FlgK [Planctomycetota bacterium]